MHTAVKLTGFATALALAFGAAWGAGMVLGPAYPVSITVPSGAAHDGNGNGSGGHGHSERVPAADGLAASQAGYSLVPQGTTFAPGAPGELAFTTTGSDTRPVTAFDVAHEKRLHLVVVRRDASSFQHLHPTLGPDGVWRTPLMLPGAGVYRAYADFVPTGGPALTLGTDLFAPGDFSPVPLPPSRITRVDGYQVRLDGELAPGGPAQVVTTVSRDGAPVTDFEPYLGAFGHLVVLRQGDLAYLHVHPDNGAAPADRGGPGIPFTAEVPSAGSFRLFLNFQHGGVVRTAEFTVRTPESLPPGRTTHR